MTALAVASITLVFTFGAAWLGGLIRERLPAPHLSKESQDLVRLGMGLVATMTALLLGLVTASARSTFDAQDTAVKNGAANLLTLDRHMRQYGEETAPIRAALRETLGLRLQITWPEQGFGQSFKNAQSSQAMDELESHLLELAPKTESERWLKTEMLKLSDEVMKTRWRALASGAAVPRAFLVVVIFWLTMTFASFGLYAPRNATVMGALLIAAISVAAALFLMVELDGPFDGIVKVSGGPLRFALEEMSR